VDNLRNSGVLMHISSLPSPYGVGTLGKAAIEFVDFLKKAGQTYWQILPVCPTSYGDSPYQSFSTFAGNPYFIDLDELAAEGLLDASEYDEIDWEGTPDRVNFGALYQKRYPVLRLAAKRFLANVPDTFRTFCMENEFWLDDYALFMTLKNQYDGKAWMEWPIALRDRDEKVLAVMEQQHKAEILFWKVTQFLFFEQWNKLRTYANSQNVDIIGDLPFYVALDSVDVWAHPELFQLDEERKPVEVAGCPPDGFSATGQLWGNPIYDWNVHEKTGYEWWIQRIGYLCRVYNVLRIDHFRGFDSYYAIPAEESNAIHGTWYEGPGMKLFRAMEEKIGKQRIIAEDLGYLTDSVKQLLSDSGFPGMKILEFGFDKREASHEDYLPENYPVHCVAYTGTHDNDTVQGWFETAREEDIEYAKEYLNMSDDADNYHWEMMEALWNSTAGWTLVQAQDLLGLGKESRMNTPSTMGTNWCWRALQGSFNDELADQLAACMKKYHRI